MKVSAQYAAEHFDDLASAVDNGEAVEIARPDKPALPLVRSSTPETPKLAGPRILGAGKALNGLPSPDALERIDLDWKRQIEEKSLVCLLSDESPAGQPYRTLDPV